MTHQFQKQYGQNFLRSDKFAHSLVDLLQISAGDVVIEVGPGDGRVTKLLLSKSAQVIAIEVDYNLLPGLISRFGKDSNFHLVHQDVLQTDTAALLTEFTPGHPEYKFISSLPYNIAKQIIKKYLLEQVSPAVMAVIIQEEVAQDYVAKCPKATFLSNWVQLYAQVKKHQSIPASQFFPRPKVNGAILEIVPYATPHPDANKVTQLLLQGFDQPRKTLRNNLRKLLANASIDSEAFWSELGLTSQARPAELPFTTWIDLANSLRI
jgi:16S rRNA (adenine1518-N6/adenine1519-N6)-dimethyltransferase